MRKLNIIFLLFFVCATIGCSDRVNDFYEGYIYNENNQPLEGVQIIEDYPKLASKGLTNNKGYFKFDRSNKNFITNLFVIKHGYRIETIDLQRGNTGQMPSFLFLRKQSDTLFMKKIISNTK
jgi:hypothetical protein